MCNSHSRGDVSVVPVLLTFIGALTVWGAMICWVACTCCPVFLCLSPTCRVTCGCSAGPVNAVVVSREQSRQVYGATRLCSELRLLSSGPVLIHDLLGVRNLFVGAWGCMQWILNSLVVADCSRHPVSVVGMYNPFQTCWYTWWHVQSVYSFLVIPECFRHKETIPGVPLHSRQVSGCY